MSVSKGTGFHPLVDPARRDGGYTVYAHVTQGRY